MTTTLQERAAMWLYHKEYAASKLGATEFYKRLGQYEKNRVDEMIDDLQKENPKRKPRTKRRGQR